MSDRDQLKRIILLNQFFWPDTVATSQLLTDVARSLAANHEVTVICGGARIVSTSSELSVNPEVVIVRTRNVEFGHAVPVRIASYVSYLAGVIWHGLLLQRPCSYLILTTPPILPVLGGIFARVRRARNVIWEMDIYPDIATGVGYFKKGGIADRLAGIILDWNRRHADAIITLGEDMKARLIARGIPEQKIHVADNWANGEEIVPLPFPDGPLTVYYSGNLGLAHELETITSVIEHFRSNPNLRFIFAGGGPRRLQFEAYCRKRSISNVEFRPYCSVADLGHSLSEGHLGLVTQLPETLGSIVPSKIYGIMAAGRPLLYIGPDESTPARHIQSFDCGWRIQPGDVESAVRLLGHLERNRHLLLEAGARGRAAFDVHFDRDAGVARILAVMSKVDAQ